jgi:hypothetical protein
MYTGRMIDLITASVQRAEEHVQQDREFQEQVLQQEYSAYFHSVAPATQRRAVA